MNERPVTRGGLRKGFSMIEITIVLVIVAMLTALVIARVGDAKANGYFRTLETNLHNLSGAMEYHMEKYGVYPNGPNGVLLTATDSLVAADTLPMAIANQAGRLESYSVAPGVSIRYLTKTATSYSVRATHSKLNAGQYCDMTMADGLQSVKINCVGQ